MKPQDSKPSLASLLVRQHFWGTALTLGLVLLGLLIVTDFTSLYLRRHTLANELRSVESVDFGTMPSVGVYSNISRDDSGYELLDEQGHWAEPRNGIPAERWREASEVIAKGEKQGDGRLPWLKGRVVWAARVMYDPETASPMIIVSWHNVDSIRSATARMTYIVVIVAITIAFLVGILINLRNARYVTKVLDDIIDSSKRMAAGDYDVKLPTQSTHELDEVSKSITSLAEDLQQTTGDLRSEHERLVRLEGLQRRFVGDASHELRAPITAMRVTLEAWQDGVLLPAEEPKALQQLMRENDRLASLVTHLLDISRIESGRESVCLTNVHIADIAEEVALGFPRDESPQIIIQIASDIDTVYADEDALYRILHNLTENARRFTPIDGTITIWARNEADEVVIGVTDTGSGIDPEFLPLIWDRFSRDPGARAEGKSGSGLGLAIVKGLAEAMCGKVSAESEVGKGTTIMIRLRREKK
ncbi:MAG: HAMP domain-containing sensor histidine kinase [bacterium]